MNEELMKELVDIIRQLKDGSPAAFNELVAQRSAYCWTGAILCILAFLSCFTVSLVSALTRIRKGEGEGYEVISAIFGVATFVAFLALVFWLPDAIAPLGRVLGGLSK